MSAALQDKLSELRLLWSAAAREDEIAAELAPFIRRLDRDLEYAIAQLRRVDDPTFYTDDVKRCEKWVEEVMQRLQAATADDERSRLWKCVDRAYCELGAAHMRVLHCQQTGQQFMDQRRQELTLLIESTTAELAACHKYRRPQTPSHAWSPPSEAISAILSCPTTTEQQSVEAPSPTQEPPTPSIHATDEQQPLVSASSLLLRHRRLDTALQQQGG